MALVTVPETVFTTLLIVSMVVLVLAGMGLAAKGCNSGVCYEPVVPTKRVMKLSRAVAHNDVVT